ncbi:MAG: sulfite exporter TauE/SafE family protein [Paracoccaceae bacterium]
MDISTLSYVYIFMAALLVGFTKTSVGGVGILAVVLMALAIPGKGSPGVMLPMLIVADIFAVIYYRRHCDWSVLLKLFPLTAVGVIIGYFTVDVIPVEVFENVIGATILFMVVFELVVPKHEKAPHWLTAFVGIFAGISTMVANAAGPIFGIYLLQMGLPKKEFVGTRSYYFLIINVFKVPFSANLGLITMDTLKLDLMFVPVLFVGAWLGYKFLGILNMNAFKWLIRAAVLVTAVRLLLF